MSKTSLRPRPLSVVLVEPYYGGSHRAWADGYRRHSRHDVHLATHESQFWKWRMQGGHLTLAAATAELAHRHGPPDVILASSMLNLAAFLGAARDAVRHAAVVLYMHESQLSYPLSPLDRSDLTYPMINWSSVAVADLVLFNSEYHRGVFFDRLPPLLRRFPDRRHLELVAGAASRSEVVPVGVDLTAIAIGPKEDPPLLLWNHRWEHDKGTADLAAALAALHAAGSPGRVAICGERFVSTPPEMSALPGLLADRLVQFGYADTGRYRALLADTAVVLSTARQEFFGISVVEAMAAGAAPVLPNGLVYRERVPPGFEEVCLYDNVSGLVDRVDAFMADDVLRRDAGDASREAVAPFDWRRVAPLLDDKLSDLVEPLGSMLPLDEPDGA